MRRTISARCSGVKPEAPAGTGSGGGCNGGGSGDDAG